MWTYMMIMLGILLFALLLLATFAFLGRFKQGRYLAPIIKVITKVGFMRRLFTKLSRAQLERQNPELVSAIDKLQRLAGPNPDPVRAQKALWQLTPSERRAYLDYMNAQGAIPESANRQMRREQQRLQAGGGPRAATKGAGKRRR